MKFIAAFALFESIVLFIAVWPVPYRIDRKLPD